MLCSRPARIAFAAVLSHSLYIGVLVEKPVSLILLNCTNNSSTGRQVAADRPIRSRNFRTYLTVIVCKRHMKLCAETSDRSEICDV